MHSFSGSEYALMPIAGNCSVGAVVDIGRTFEALIPATWPRALLAGVFWFLCTDLPNGLYFRTPYSTLYFFSSFFRSFSPVRYVWCC